jgi:hypothetical protein
MTGAASAVVLRFANSPWTSRRRVGGCSPSRRPFPPPASTRDTTRATPPRRSSRAEAVTVGPMRRPFRGGRGPAVGFTATSRPGGRLTAPTHECFTCRLGAQPAGHWYHA